MKKPAKTYATRPLKKGDGVWYRGQVWTVAKVELFDGDHGPAVTLQRRKWSPDGGKLGQMVIQSTWIWPESTNWEKDWWKLFGEDMKAGRLSLSDRGRVVEWDTSSQPCPRWLPSIMKDKKVPAKMRGTVVTREDFPSMNIPLAVYIGSSPGNGRSIDWLVADYELDAAEGFQFLN